MPVFFRSLGFHRGQRESFRELSAGREDERGKGLRTDLWTAPGEVCLVFLLCIILRGFGRELGHRRWLPVSREPNVLVYSTFL